MEIHENRGNALKLLARDDPGRPQDAADLATLIPMATPADLKKVGELVGLIEDRNFHRGRDLKGDLERLVASIGGLRD